MRGGYIERDSSNTLGLKGVRDDNVISLLRKKTSSLRIEPTQLEERSGASEKRLGTVLSNTIKLSV